MQKLKFIKKILAVSAVLAVLASMIVPTTPVSAAGFELLTTGSHVTVNGVTFEAYTPKLSSGTGVFKLFVRLQHASSEKGYNTDGITPTI